MSSKILPLTGMQRIPVPGVWEVFIVVIEESLSPLANWLFSIEIKILGLFPLGNGHQVAIPFGTFYVSQVIYKLATESVAE